MNRAETPRPAASYFAVDFEQTPFTLAWEITRACALNCVHCRAAAQHRRHPMELTTEEGLRLIDQIVEIGKPILVITGGDPLMRQDVFTFIEHAAQQGLRVALSPSATRLVTRARLRRAQDAGVHMVHISVDGSRPEIHDAFRGFPGTFQRSMEIIDDLRALGIPFQIGTTVSRYNLADLPDMAALITRLGLAVWSVFFLVPTGRGEASDMVSPEEHERVYHWLYDLSQQSAFHVRTTAAQAYRRVVIQRTRQAAVASGDTSDGTVRWELTGAGYAFREGRAPVERGVNDGNGFAFVDHLGNVCPSGFLQLPGGNVHSESLAAVYRNAPLFRDLRDPGKLKGKCGVCEFKNICGGSRGRAYAVSGDYLASDPTCVYVPAALRTGPRDPA